MLSDLQHSFFIKHMQFSNGFELLLQYVIFFL